MSEQSSRDLHDQVVSFTRREGFAPQPGPRGDRIEVALGADPFVDAVMADSDTMRSLHLAYGLADRLGGMVVDDLERRDPRSAGCRLRLHMEGEYPGLQVRKK